jgi:hypothetical protein
VAGNGSRVGGRRGDRVEGSDQEVNAVLQIALIAAFFNSINRVADALGVGKSEADGT